MKAILLKIKHEAMKALPPTVFFFIILHIVAVIRALMMKGTGVSLPVSASVLIASLVLGKSVLVADMLPFINRFPEKPLIWNVLWKTLHSSFTIWSGCTSSGKKRPASLKRMTCYGTQ
jgi:hypothetical protein